MRRLFLIALTVLAGVCSFAQQRDVQEFFVGTYTKMGAEGIYRCSLNTETGEIKLENTFKAVDNPSFLKLSPDRKYLYAVSEISETPDGKQGFLLAYGVDKKGDLHFLNKQSSNGDGPCHVDVSGDGKLVAIATYGSATTSLFPVRDDGSLGPVLDVVQNTGSGPNRDRQQEPHAHSIKFSPWDTQVFGADLGTDQLNILRLDNTAWHTCTQAFVKMPGGAGPRHFAFHPQKEVIYVINELNSTITAIRREENEWKRFQNISTLPAGFSGESYCADIHISNDGKFLYGSNRGHNSIAIFAVNENDQSLNFLKTVSVEGTWPRNFGLTPDGNWLLVANQNSGNIAVFKVNKQTGDISYSGEQIQIPAPVCIEFL